MNPDYCHSNERDFYEKLWRATKVLGLIALAVFLLLIVRESVKNTGKDISNEVGQGTFVGIDWMDRDGEVLSYNAHIHTVINGKLCERSVKLSYWPKEASPGDEVRIIVKDNDEIILKKITPGWGP